LNAERQTQVVRSEASRRAAVLTAPTYPSTVTGPGARLSVVDPEGSLWQAPGLDTVVGLPAWSADGSALAGYAWTDGHPQPWVAWPTERRVTVGQIRTPDVEQPPIGWAGPDRVLVALPDDLPPREPSEPVSWAPLAWEATPFSRIRLRPVEPSGTAWRPYRLGVWELPTQHPVENELTVLPLPAGVYLAVRATRDGERIATLAADTAGGYELTSLTWTPTGYVVDTVIHLDGVPGGVACRDDGVVVTLLRGESGVLLHYPFPGEGQGRVLCDNVLIPDTLGLPAWLPWTLVTEDGASLIVVDGSGLRRFHSLPPPTPSPVRVEVIETAQGSASASFAIAVTDRAGHRQIMVVDSGPDSAPPRTRHRISLGPGEDVIGVTDWERGILRITDGSDIRTVTACHIPIAAPPRLAPARSPAGLSSHLQWVRIPDPLGDGRAEVTCVLPSPSDQRASGFVVLRDVPSGALSSRPAEGSGEETLRGFPLPRLLAGLGFPVGVLDLEVPWWPEVPDDRIRPGIADRVAQLVTVTRKEGDLGDRDLVVAGHSFGASLALIALADTDAFQAAVVSSGAYSRMWTPLGFQAEHRTLWEAERVYRDFDALLNAPRIRRPVLILHGLADAHPATPPGQAELLFQALTAVGTPCRLVLLPGEGHTFTTREGLETAVLEHARWAYRWCDVCPTAG